MNVIRNARLSRRTVLRGVGAALALPLLDAMIPAARLFAAESPAARRLVFLYVPNGVHLPAWTPAVEGPLKTLSPILESLAPHAADVQVLSGLTLDGARDHNDGSGDHARASAAFLTGAHARKTGGADLRCATSVDQMAATKLGDATPLPSLELGCDEAMTSGQCDNAYSCAYSANISWKSETMPMSKEVDPRLAFERLFGGPSNGETAEARLARLALRRSVLDAVGEDAKRLSSRLGATDRAKLDEYLAAVRDMERRLDRAAKGGDAVAPVNAARPTGIPADFREHLKLMLDLVVLGFRADATRVVTFMFGNEQTNRSYPMIGVPEAHHEVSHHGGDPAKHEKITRINRFHAEQLAYFLAELKKNKEADATLLDASAVVYGSAISDGNRHNHEDLPILVAGRLGGALSPGKHVRYPAETPLCNLHLALLGAVGVKTTKFGDSTGVLVGI